MKKIKLLLIFLGISFPSLIIAQDRVFIPDTAFGSFLCEEFPSEMSINCDSINYGSESITGDLIILGRGIYDLTGIKAFTKLNKLFIGNTSITTVPRLPESPNLTLVNILRGQVNDFEDGFIPIDNNLDVLNFNTNNISQIPDLANASSTLTRLFINENKLKTLPSLNYLSELNELELLNNYLTFEDLLPLLDHPKYDSSTFILTPQNKQEFTNTELELVEGTNGAYHLLVDKDVDGNSFQWYKNGNPYKSTSENYLEFNSIQLSDTGNYTVVITNSSAFFQDLEISFSNEFEVKVIPSINGITSKTFTNCESHIVSLDETKLPFLNSGTEYLLIDSLTEASQLLEGNSFTLTTQGTFDFVHIQDGEAIQHIKNWVTLPNLPLCNGYLTPDGDGVDDTYYFEDEGEIQIIGKSAHNRIQLNGPVIWDGKDSNGNVVQPGLYLIILPENRHKHISVVH